MLEMCDSLSNLLGEKVGVASRWAGVLQVEFLERGEAPKEVY
jgi:hypothetical protein